MTWEDYEQYMSFNHGQKHAASVLRMIKRDMFAVLLHDTRAVVCVKALVDQASLEFSSLSRASYSSPIPVKVSLVEFHIPTGVFSSVLHVEHNFMIKQKFTTYRKVQFL